MLPGLFLFTVLVNVVTPATQGTLRPAPPHLSRTWGGISAQSTRPMRARTVQELPSPSHGVTLSSVPGSCSYAHPNPLVLLPAPRFTEAHGETLNVSGLWTSR